MIFQDIPASTSLFIDANTFVYHFTPHPILQPACSALLARIARHEVLATTSTHVVNDVAHRVMTTEAVAKFGWPVAGIAQRLRKHPAKIMQLSLFRQAIDDINQFGVRIVVPPASINSAAAIVSQQYGLLSGDALIVAIMQQFGLSSIASHDADFDRVPWIMRFSPA
ncbi:MAG: type II toxin-antitoxin system VapC family toxin [Pirellulales bacterium]